MGAMTDSDDLTVGQVAELLGVTVRTLHHYDQLGLLVPSGRSHADYRLYSADDLRRWQSMTSQPNGIILVTGPTGSGKTTTLYAGLRQLNDGSRNILTVEDPVEYAVEGVGQTQVNAKVGLTFAAGLRAILRQDPDVVMVGEIRDLETAEMAIQAALTGHLVLSTLHTNTAAGAVIEGYNAVRQERRESHDCAVETTAVH